MTDLQNVIVSNVPGFIQLLYDTTCLNLNLWVKPVWGVGCMPNILNKLNHNHFLKKIIHNMHFAQYFRNIKMTKPHLDSILDGMDVT